MNHKLRLVINSNAPYSISGYGQQMQELVPRIKKEGYEIATINFFGLQGNSIETKDLPGVKQYPVVNHTYGSDAMVLHGADFKADAVFTLQDVWVLHPNDLQQVKRWIPIVPIDHDPVQKPVLEALKYAYKIITYSKFGQEQLRKRGLYSTYIPHTVDTEIFKPMDKKERKKKAGISPDCFLVGMVAANKDNPPRKSFQEVLDGFKMFLEKEPKALLYFHTNPQFPGGFPIDSYAEFIGIRDKVLFPDNYTMNFNTGKKEMNLIYNTFDVLLNPSRHEGFGVALIEAQASGVPVIGNRWTSMVELVKEGETGYLTDLLYKPFSLMGSYMGQPDPKSIFECLMKVRESDRVKMGEKARTFMLEEFDSNKVFKEKWIPFLSQLESEVYPTIAQEKEKNV